MKDTFDRNEPQTLTTNSFTAWPHLDRSFEEQVVPLTSSPDGRMVSADLNRRFPLTPDCSVPFGRPLAVMPGQRHSLNLFVVAYHRAIETIVASYREDRRLRDVLSMPVALHRDLTATPHNADSRVHFMRLDVLPQPDGSVRVLETNANCPGGLVVASYAARRWREYLTSWGQSLPEPLAGEDPLWMARWFTQVAEEETGKRPRVVALLRQEGGNRFELDLIRMAFEGIGVQTIEADPREMESWSGGVRIRGVDLRHAYLKLGMQEFCAMRGEVELFVHAVRSGDLFVQNRQLGRWVGDNKLCLAVLSDPDFFYLFDKDDLELLAPSIPWSRNVATCATELLETIRRNPMDYVLKRPLDTKGRGVVVGCEAQDLDEWSAALDLAHREGWLIQEHCVTTEIEPELGSGEAKKHDLALGAVNGSLSAVFLRSSAEARMNVARTAHLHSIYL